MYSSDEFKLEPIIFPYGTSDIGCAAPLIAANYPLLSLDRSDPHRVQFVFEYSKKLQATVDAYWGCKKRIDARTYFEALKSLKSRVYNGQSMRLTQDDVIKFQKLHSKHFNTSLSSDDARRQLTLLVRQLEIMEHEYEDNDNTAPTISRLHT